MDDNALIPGFDLIVPGDAEGIKNLQNEYAAKVEEINRDRIEISRRNEAFYNGHQNLYYDLATGMHEDIWTGPTPRVEHNHLRHIIETSVSRLMKDRPSVTAYPTHNQAVDRGAAEIVRQLIEYMEEEMNVDDLLFQVVRLGTLHGTAGIKVAYDPQEDRIFWDPVSLFEMRIDPNAEHGDAAKWVQFISYVDRWEGMDMLRKAGIGTPPAETDYCNGVQTEERFTQRGVEVIEFWHLPTARVPKGLYSRSVGGEIVESLEYPLWVPNLEKADGSEIAVLPLATYKHNFRRGTPLGDTWLDDCVAVQRHINENESVLTRQRRLSGGIHLMGPSHVLDEIKISRNEFIAINGNERMEYLSPPPIAQVLFADRDHLFRKLYDLAGLNEVLSGVENPKSGTSARQISYLQELDGMKHAGTSRQIEGMVLRAWRITLAMMRVYYPSERIVKISGSDSVTEIAFRGADIAGVDVRLEPRTGYERYTATKAQHAIEDAQQQWIQPQQAMDMRDVGQAESLFIKSQEDLLEREISAVMQGAQPGLEVDASIAVDALGRRLQLAQELGLPPQISMVIQGLMQAYRQRMQQQQQAQAQGNRESEIGE